VKRQVCCLCFLVQSYLMVPQKLPSPEETASDEDDSFLPDDEDESHGDVESGVW
jgi:hypothetical protein